MSSRGHILSVAPGAVREPLHIAAVWIHHVKLGIPVSIGDKRDQTASLGLTRDRLRILPCRVARGTARAYEQRHERRQGEVSDGLPPDGVLRERVESGCQVIGCGAHVSYSGLGGLAG